LIGQCATTPRLRAFRPNSIFDLLRRQFCNPREDIMAWKKPAIVEISVGMEINMYACAVRK
jgi:coenzyme PQQ precursor peptide PqqA